VSVTVLCVLKGGGEYRPKHAARLFDQFLQHAPVDCEFLCLTDQLREVEALNVPAVPLTAGWPGWWSKIEALATPGPCLYLDLDVSIVGDLGPLLAVAREEPLCMCRGFWGLEDPNPWNSSVVGWSGDAAAVYREFAKAPQAHMSVYAAKERWGDQAFIKDHWPGGAKSICLWQERLPGMVLSFKRDILRGAEWRDVRVVVSHGKPRPWDDGGADWWLKRHDHP
jgi:hypothetical protein